MDKILTVIIPTYNMEDYLRYCLDSLLIKENFKQLEVLIINDGSKDSSSAIGHEYEQLYPEVFRVIDKENGNYGSCINRGLKEAKGKYVKILDADDSFHTKHFEAFVSFLVEIDADLILSDFAVVNVNREVKKIIHYCFGEEKLYDFKSICNTHTFKNMQMHAVTYRRENLLNFEYQQTEGISYTDQQWIFLPMMTVKSVACFNRFVYKYLIGREGQTVNSKDRLKGIVQISRCAADVVSGYEYHKKDMKEASLLEYMYGRMIPLVKNVYVFLLTHYEDETKKMLTDFDEQIKSLSDEIYEHIGSKEISSFMGFEYINYWRKNKSVNPLIIKLMSKSYLLLLKSRQALQKTDEMAVPASL